MNIIDTLMDNMDAARKNAQSSQHQFNQAMLPPTTQYATLTRPSYTGPDSSSKAHISQVQIMAYTT
jgi:hypothetical protein